MTFRQHEAIEPGAKFGALMVVCRAPDRKNQQARYLCVCACGAEFNALAYRLRNGETVSCRMCAISSAMKGNTFGRREVAKSHHSSIASWRAMHARCYDTSHVSYGRYGGRGIVVCDEWHGDDGFFRFAAHIGERPGRGYSVDRINNDGNYEPGNVRWATAKEQAANRSFHGRAPARRMTDRMLDAAPAAEGGE